MKSFLIKAPAKGKTTCTLVRQYYDKASRRTKTQYLGSFNVALDPSILPTGVRLRPDVEIDAEQLAEVASWLKQNGTFGQTPMLSAAVLEQARRHLMEVMHDERMQVHQQSDLELAASILNGAAMDIQHASAQLRLQGIELSSGMLIYTGTDMAKCINDMDRLKVQSNQIRAAATQFEEALKEAKLMKRLNKIAKADSHATH